MIAPDPKLNAPGLAAVLAERLAKLVGDDEDAPPPKENVGEAPNEDVDEPKAGVEEAGVELPKENAGVEAGLVGGLVDEVKPPNAGVSFVAEGVLLPNENVGLVDVGAAVEDAGVVLPNVGAVEVDALDLEAPKLTGLPPKEKPELGRLN